MRPHKIGLEYFPLDVDIDSDDKIALIEAQYGVEGFGIVIKIFMKIYKCGYFYKWSEKEQLLFAKRINVDRNRIKDIVKDCLKWKLFDPELHSKYQILTSSGIQKRYFQATCRRQSIDVIREYLILSQSEVNAYENIVIVDIKPYPHEVNGGISTQSKAKESKVNNAENNSCEGIKDSEGSLSELQTIMQFYEETILSTWYIWLIIILFGILGVFAPKIKGYLGEKSVVFFLSQLDPSKYRVINKLMLNNGSGTSQIDHVVISGFGIFVIETKNYRGWILGSERSDYWTQVIYKRKEKLRNPILQNYGHIQALKAALAEFPNLPFISIVTFTTRVDLKVNVTTDVVYTTNLTKTISKYRILCISNEVKEVIYQKILSLNVDSRENRQSHVQTIHDNMKERNTKMANDICPRCGGKLVIRNGKYGSFKGCSNYPKCRFTAR